MLRQAGGRILLLRLGGPMSFGAAKSISKRMTMVENYEVLILDLSDVPLLGVTASLAIETMVKEACDKGREVFIVGATGKVKKRLQRLEVMDLLPLRNRVNDRTEALRQAIIILDGHQLHPASSGMRSGKQ